MSAVTTPTVPLLHPGQILIISFLFSHQIVKHLYFLKWVLLVTLRDEGHSR